MLDCQKEEDFTIFTEVVEIYRWKFAFGRSIEPKKSRRNLTVRIWAQRNDFLWKIEHE